MFLFEVEYLVPADAAVPSPQELHREVEAISQHVEFSEGGARGALWSAEYSNPETLVTFTFICSPPAQEVIDCDGATASPSGLRALIPCTCPTFVARESLPIVVKLATRGCYWLSISVGKIIKRPNTSHLLTEWTEINRQTCRQARLEGNLYSLPLEQTDGLWHYANARQQLIKRYASLSLAVPRISLLRDKNARDQVYRTIFWTEQGPTVIPGIDALILSKPGRLLFGRFPIGEPENVVVRLEDIQDLLSPHWRSADRPFTHLVLEDPSPLRLPLMRRLIELQPPKYTNFETVPFQEIVDA